MTIFIYLTSFSLSLFHRNPKFFEKYLLCRGINLLNISKSISCIRVNDNCEILIPNSKVLREEDWMKATDGNIGPVFCHTTSNHCIRLNQKIFQDAFEILRMPSRAPFDVVETPQPNIRTEQQEQSHQRRRANTRFTANILDTSPFYPQRTSRIFRSSSHLNR